MAKLPNLEHVKYVRSKGKLYAYFNTGQKDNGKPIYARLPDPSAPGFYDSYAAFKAGRTKRAKVEYTIADMARDYERSAKFSTLAHKSQTLYALTLKRIVAALGDFPINDLHRPDVQAVLDNEITGIGARHIFLAVLGALYTWGNNQGKTELQPTRGIERIKGGAHDPWPEAALEAALESENDRIRLAVHLLYFTGQRISDVVAMRWTDIKKGILYITPQKTKRHGVSLTIPICAALQAELDRTPKRGMTILTSQNGRPITAQSVRKELQAFTAGLGYSTVPHGLRKNAVITLLEAGCTPSEVAAITGQTLQMVAHYAEKVSQKRLASAAILKWEAKREKSALLADRNPRKVRT